MAKIKPVTPKPRTDWSVAYEHVFDDGKRLEPGIEFKLTGERGKTYRYIKTVTNEAGETWIDCFGGSTANPKSRAVFPDRVQTDSIKRPRKKR